MKLPDRLRDVKTDGKTKGLVDNWKHSIKNNFFQIIIPNKKRSLFIKGSLQNLHIMQCAVLGK